MSWWQRFQQRQYDLARGVDADLVRDTTTHSRLSMALFCLALLLAWIAHKLPLPYSLRLAAIILAAVSLIAGAVLSRWTMAEDRFLRKPDPEPPPSIFKR